MLLKNLTALFLLFAVLVAKGQSGPGGVGNSTSNGLWLRSEDISLANNDPVVTWSDFSGNGNNATAVVTEQPLFISSSSINSLPAVRFDGNNDVMTVADVAILDGSAGLTYFAVLRPNNLDGSPRPIFGKRVSFGSSDYAYTWFFFGSNYLTLDINTGNNRFNTSPTAFSNSTNYILSFNYDGSLAASVRSTIYSAGSLITTSTESSTSVLNSSADLTLGTLNAGDGRELGADYAELIHYNFSLNDAQTIIVNNYLSAKYDIALTANDIYDEDDLANGNYDYDVAGIGRVDASNLHTDSRGTGIVQVTKTGGGLGNNEFLFWGHDNGLLGTFGGSDVPVGVDARMIRTWRVSEQGEPGSVLISFDLTGLGPVTASDLRLLIDSDADGDFSNATVLTGAADLGSNVYQFSTGTNNTLEDGYAFTIATTDANNTPLPIELLRFDAIVSDNGKVRLEWETATEINNDFFSIERSRDAENWSHVKTVPGSGNSNVKLEYSELDENPLIGTSYYRLKQTDYNGRFTYSDLKAIYFKLPSQFANVSVYPNPSKGRVAIRFDSSGKGTATLKVFDFVGIMHYSKDIALKEGENVIETDNSFLPSGQYFFQIIGSNGMSIQKPFSLIRP